MPPRPFPFPIGVGTDICSIHRINRIVQRPPAFGEYITPEYGPRLRPFLMRMFSFPEIVHFHVRFPSVLVKGPKNDTPEQVIQATRYLAGRFAAKEAVIKAVKPRRLYHRDIMIMSAAHAGDSFTGPYAIILDKSPVVTPLQRLYLQRFFQWRAFVDPQLDEQYKEARFSTLNFPELSADPRNFDGQIAKLSISHDGDYATATCLAIDQQTTENPLVEDSSGDQ